MSIRVARFMKARLSLFAFLTLLAPAATLIGSSAAHAEQLRCEHLPVLFDAYFRGHYAFKGMSEEIKTRTVDQLIKSIDPSKTLFLEQDVQKLKKDLPVLFTTMKEGSCPQLDELYQIMTSRSKENEDFVRKILDDKYKLDETVQLNLDPEKRGWSKTNEERMDLVRKLVHFQISNYLLTDLKLPDAKKQLVHRYELITKRLAEKNPQQLVTSYAESFAQALDPHSTYLSQDNLEDFQIQMHLSLEGIGASLSSQDGFTVIEETIPGGGAEKSKVIRPKDKIISVAQDGKKGVSVIDMDLRDVVKLIRGKKGTKVTLTILRQGDKTSTFDVTIVRDKIDIKDSAAKITYETRKVGDKTLKFGVIDLPSFYGGGDEGRSCSADVKKLLEEAKKEKVSGIVLNLSRNGGGLLEEAVRISGLFIRKGEVVATKDSDKHVQTLADEDSDVVWSGPLVLLESRMSASASEILAGALKDYKRAIIIGSDHSFGKGTVQAVSRLPMGLGAMKVTTGMFFLPGGNSTQHRGVSSDIHVPSVFNNEEVGEKQLDYSLPPQAIPAFLSKEANSSDPLKHWDPVQESTIKFLAEKSKERVAKDPKFAEIRKELEDAAKNKGMIKLADIRKKSAEELKAEKKKNKKNREEKIKDLDAPMVNEGVNVLSDWINSLSSPATTGPGQVNASRN